METSETKATVHRTRAHHGGYGARGEKRKTALFSCGFSGASRGGRFPSKGFTLLEVLVALTILIISLTCFATLHLASIFSDSHNGNMIEAANLCNKQIETLRNYQTFANIVTSTSATQISQPPFTITWTVITNPAWEDNVTVTATWQEKTGTLPMRTITRQLQMSGIIVNLNAPP